MSSENTQSIPVWFRITGFLALIWNLLGVSAYIMQVRMTEADLAALPEAQQMLYETTPAWATGAFATAVFAGALGCLLLVMRKGLAIPVLIVSLLAVLVQMFHAFFMSKNYRSFVLSQQRRLSLIGYFFQIFNIYLPSLPRWLLLQAGCPVFWSHVQGPGHPDNNYF